jgi:hypothetical protein
MMQNVVFAASGLAVGSSYDELVDTKSGKHYFSGVYDSLPGESRYHDYGYFSTFPGPNGNQIVVIAGMRDVGVMDTAETVTSVAGLQQLRKQGAALTNGFEALYEVFGLGHTNMDAKLMLARPLAAAHIWQDSAH